MTTRVWRDRLVLCAALAVGFAGFARAESTPVIPPDWLRTVPGPREAAAIENGATRHGWPGMARALRTAGLAAYARGDLAVADAWRNTARWALAWSETRADFVKRRAGAPTGGDFPPPPSAAISGADTSLMAASLPPETRIWLLGDGAFSAAYFALESPMDDRLTAWGILTELHAKDPAVFRNYAELALAIALVYDAAPPREWPHWQVTESALPRRLPSPLAAWEFFITLDRSGRSLHRLANLDAAELRFMVDLAAPAEELHWAQERVKVPLAKLDATYGVIAYRTDRITTGAYVWPGSSYTLDAILREGGICVDQAYFATQTGKARGVPTLLFGGAGRDGRHAWFGYLGTGRKWNLDAGRYEEQKYVTGAAIDPQTWTEISDHELAFLSEGFRREKPTREANTHASFARWLLEDGRTGEAETAARAAVRLERRTVSAWEVLLSLRPSPGAEREAIAREAASGLTAYPELQAHFLDIAIGSLRARGEPDEAERLSREAARRFAAKRGDLTVAQLARQLAGAAKDATVEEQVRLHRSLLRQFGRGAGAAMWDEVVRPFVVRLAEAGHVKAARSALADARSALRVGLGSQLDGEMRGLEAFLAKAVSAEKPANPAHAP